MYVWGFEIHFRLLLCAQQGSRCMFSVRRSIRDGVLESFRSSTPRPTHGNA